MAYEQDWVNQLVREAAAQAGGTLSYADALNAANNLGIPEAQLLNAISTNTITDYGDYVRSAPEAKKIESAFQNELGVSPADIDYALSLAHLKAGGSLESGQQFLNDSAQGKAYDQYLKSYPASADAQKHAGAKVEQFTTPTLEFNVEDVSAPYGGWKDRRAVGASDGSLMGAGNANYNSALVKSLRQNSISPISNNQGVMVIPNQSSEPMTWTTPTTSSGAAFSPQVLNPRAASPQEVTDWNSYNTYRTNSLQAKTPYLSFAEWLTGGKGDGKPGTTTTPEASGPTVDYSGGGG